MQRSKSQRKLRGVICFLIAILSCVLAYGQAHDPDVFASVPAPSRARLVERLKLLIEYQRTQQWEKQYDLLAVTVTQGDSREDHVTRLQRWYAEGLGDTLLEFTPKHVTYGSGAPFDAAIFGCARLRERGRIVEFYASVEAYRENDDWYFSPVGVVTPIDGKRKPCPYSTPDTAAHTSSRCSAANGKNNKESRQW